MWPTPQDYNEAIQNPRLAFKDVELQAGQAVVDQLGLPKPITGAFASVYEVNCNGKRWAVRCFLREFSDLQDRYRHIGEFLQSARLSFMAQFEYLHEGIRVGRQWFPILKMEWIRGEPLNEYVQRNLDNKAALGTLAREWTSLLAQLGRVGIAHGDLQHGNVLVDQGRIKLIDYDGMYVPALRGWLSHEQGHRNYQHPRRTGRDFDPHIDNFSAWVIFASLAALAVEPRLWTQVNGGDECLIFRGSDFENPTQSAAFRALARSSDTFVNSLPARLASFLKLPLAQIGALDTGSVPSRPAAPSPASVGEWIKDHLQVSESIGTLKSESQSRLGVAWIIDHLVETEVVAAPAPWENLTALRIWMVTVTVLYALIIGVLAATFSTMLWYLLLVLPVGIAAMVFQSWRSQPCHERKVQCTTVCEAIKTQVARIQAQLKTNVASVNRLREPVAIVKEQGQAAETGIQNQIQDLDRAYRRSCDNLDSDIAECDQQESSRLQALANSLRNTVTSLQSCIQESHNLEALELQRTSSEHAERIVQEHLVRAKIRDAWIPHIGTDITQRLEQNGFRNAADVQRGNVQIVEGVGVKRANELSAWAWEQRREALRRSACHLPRPIQREIEQKHSAARRALNVKIENARREQAQNSAAVRAEYERKREEVTSKRTMVRHQFEVERQKLEKSGALQREQFVAELRRLEDQVAQATKANRTVQRKLHDSLFSAKLQLAKAERELRHSSASTLPRFILCVLGLNRVSAWRSTSRGVTP